VLLRTLMQMAGRCMRPLTGKHAYWLHLRLRDKGACLSYAEGLRGVLQNYNLQTKVWEAAPLRSGDNRLAAIENEFASPLEQQLLLDELDATAAELSTVSLTAATSVAAASSDFLCEQHIDDPDYDCTAESDGAGVCTTDQHTATAAAVPATPTRSASKQPVLRPPSKRIKRSPNR
jgi:hypothetical protein